MMTTQTGWEFVACKQSEPDWERYLLFLLTYHAEWNLPYDFQMKLSFIGIPISAGNAILCIDPQTKDPVGTIGFVYGTGAQHYEDTHICQVEIAFLAPSYRRTRLFIRGLQQFVKVVAAENPGVRLVQFWSPGENEYLRTLFSKFANLTKTNEKPFGKLDLFTTRFDDLQLFCSRFLIESDDYD